MVADFAKKRNKEFFSRELLFKSLGVALIIIVILLLLVDFKMYQRKQEMSSQINALQKQIEDIKKSSQTLKDEIANSNSTDYLEKIAYEQLNQQKPGEKEIIFVAPQEKSKTTAIPESLWNIKSWLGWFSNAWVWIKSKI